MLRSKYYSATITINCVRTRRVIPTKFHAEYRRFRSFSALPVGKRGKRFRHVVTARSIKRVLTFGRFFYLFFISSPRPYARTHSTPNRRPVAYSLISSCYHVRRLYIVVAVNIESRLIRSVRFGTPRFTVFPTER